MTSKELARLIEQLRSQRERVVVAIDGGTALGKSTLARQLARELDAIVIGTDSYVIPRNKRTISPCNPDCFRLDELTRDIRRLHADRHLWLGEYDHRTGTNGPPTLRRPAGVLIIEGAHALKLPLSVDLGIFIDAPEDVMRERRRARDQSLGIADDHWNHRWPEHYEAFKQFILPQAEHADMSFLSTEGIAERLTPSSTARMPTTRDSYSARCESSSPAR